MSISQDPLKMPWETLGFSKEYDLAEKTGGLFDLSDWGVVEITGADAEDYLNRMSTLGFKTWDRKGLAHGSLLTGKGQVVSLGLFQSIDGGFHFLVPQGQAAATAEHLEKFHFAERLTIKDVSENWSLWLGKGVSEKGIWKDDLRTGWEWFKISKSERAGFTTRNKTLQALGQKLFEYYRLKAAIPRVGIEVGDAIILETGFDRAVSRNKGCYPGQEVVERIFTYGSVNRKLLRLEWSGPETRSQEVAYQDKILVDGREMIDVVSRLEHPHQNKSGLALGYVHKSLWGSDAKWLSQNQIEYRLFV